MSLETLPFDAARYFKAPGSQTELIADALESGDAAYIAATLDIVVRTWGKVGTAPQVGVTSTSLYKAPSENCDQRLAKLLGATKGSRSLAHRRHVKP